ncbi:hypothetical protein [Streptomyces alkaliphilus]|uniref:hypothetical protein n=1 Tax=Streptomyces alkaliphilus TaxID=1472722 RepID=UPI003F670F6C
MTAVQASVEQSGEERTGAPNGRDQYPAGALVVVRDEEWLVRSSMPTSDDGTRIEVTGVSEFVRDQEAVFFSGLDRIELLDPGATGLAMDDSPNYRRSRLFLEAVLRRTALPQSEHRLALADSFLMDPLPYQRRPAQLALSGANLRPRLLIADVVGLGKTLESQRLRLGCRRSLTCTVSGRARRTASAWVAEAVRRTRPRCRDARAAGTVEPVVRAGWDHPWPKMPRPGVSTLPGS